MVYMTSYDVISLDEETHPASKDQVKPDGVANQFTKT